MLAYGLFGREERASLEEAALASHVQLHTTASSSEASAWLDVHEAAAILLGKGEDPPESLALGTRAQTRHRQVPILALTRAPTDFDFADAYSWGADDVVSPEKSWSVTQRLRALTRNQQGEEPTPRGTAVIAEVDQFRRVATARALFNAGYDVRFALTSKDARDFALEPKVSLVVACTELCEDPSSFIKSATGKATSTHWIVSAEPRRHNELSQILAREPNVRLTEASAPPENVVFLANELCAGPMPNKRKSPRILNGTSVSFRIEGREEDEVGFTYNVSEGGLYVRTLAPPTEDLVWLELLPPKSSRRVRLVGEVAWRRHFGPAGRATVPPGFGVKIVDGARICLERWKESCTLSAQELFSHSFLPPSLEEEEAGAAR